MSQTAYTFPEGIACIRFDPPAGQSPRGCVVAVHGLTRQKRDFDYIGQSLSALGWQVFAMDAPGRGDSLRVPPEEYHLDAYADIFAAVLRAHFDTPVHWLGTSMGGLIAMNMGARGYADLFKTVTLIDITHKPHPAACARIADYVVENLPTFPSVDSYLNIMKPNLALGDVSDDVWRHYAAHQLREENGEFIFHFDPAIARLAAPMLRAGIDLSEGLQKITCPMALVAGGKSDLCTAQEIADIKMLKPDLALHMCPDAGHIPALADADTQNFIAGFIERHAA